MRERESVSATKSKQTVVTKKIQTHKKLADIDVKGLSFEVVGMVVMISVCPALVMSYLSFSPLDRLWAEWASTITATACVVQYSVIQRSLCKLAALARSLTRLIDFRGFWDLTDWLTCRCCWLTANTRQNANTLQRLPRGRWKGKRDGEKCRGNAEICKLPFNACKLLLVTTEKKRDWQNRQNRSLGRLREEKEGYQKCFNAKQEEKISKVRLWSLSTRLFYWLNAKSLFWWVG